MGTCFCNKALELKLAVAALLCVWMFACGVEAGASESGRRLSPRALLSIEKGSAGDTVVGPAQESVALYQSIENFNDAPYGEFVGYLNEVFGSFSKAINTSRQEFLDGEDSEDSFDGRKIQSVEAVAKQVRRWALDEAVSGRARVFRLVFATAKVQELTNLVHEENEGWRFSLRGRSVHEKLKVRLPCEVYKRYPNASVDAFLVSAVRPDGSYAASNVLETIIGYPFSCPTVPFFSADESNRKGIEDYVQLNRYLNGQSLDAWFESHLPKSSAEEVSETEDRDFPEYDYESTMKTLEGSDDPNDILLLALLMHTYERNGNTREIAEMLSGLEGKLESVNPSDFEPDEPYDGTDESMVKHLMHYSVNHLGDEAYFTIPCGVLIDRPGLLPALSPFYGGNLDNFLPRDDCDEDKYPLPASVYRYLNIVNEPQDDGIDGYQGTMRFSHGRELNKEHLMIRVFPSQLLENASGISDRYPYETWSYLNIENRRVYERIRSSHIEALEDLTRHYSSNFGLASKDARLAASEALWQIVDEGHWGSPPRSGLRYMILEGEPYGAIERVVNSVEDLDQLEHSKVRIKNYEHAWSYVGAPDPLIMMAVRRPNVLELLLKKENQAALEGSDYQHGEPMAYTNANTAIDAKNPIGKNALHAAVQQNALESVKLLLEAGADLSAVVEGPMTHNNRTVAMYAAANGDLELIRYLKDQNVDFTVVDSEAAGLIGYLMGLGELDINPEVTRTNFKQFVDLINPSLFSPGGGDIEPSYDCERSRSFAEKAVCSDSHLSIMDRVLSYRYKRHYDGATDKSEVKQSQIAWIRSRNKCRESQCVRDAYRQRIGELTSEDLH
ncbi:ankyrin repeat domain-containing protein [Marinimicrobium locisalis]|uniref:ankyrin repeat domain-containing protein n=1 Tax=Marinimicrobium locisalis TaxID=546022 RepID=UPI003221480B